MFKHGFYSEYSLKGAYVSTCGCGQTSDYDSESVPMGYLVAYFWKVEQSDANLDFYRER